MTAQRTFTYASAALFIGGLIHVIGLFMGPDAIAFLGAPEAFVQDYRDGKLLHVYAVTLGIAGLLFWLGWLSWRARPPRIAGKFTRFVLILFAAIFTLRGLLIIFFIPAIFKGSYNVDPLMFWFHVAASAFVLTIGLALTQGLVKTAERKP